MNVIVSGAIEEGGGKREKTDLWLETLINYTSVTELLKKNKNKLKIYEKQTNVFAIL